MEFSVPKFIERQPHIVGPVTFRQFMFLLGVAGVLGIFWLTIPSKFLFYLVASVMVLFSFMAVFVKINGRPFATVLFGFIRYTFGAKLFLWERKSGVINLIKKTPAKKTAIKKDQPDEISPLQISERSRLHEMSRRIETGS